MATTYFTYFLGTKFRNKVWKLAFTYKTYILLHWLGRLQKPHSYYDKSGVFCFYFLYKLKNLSYFFFDLPFLINKSLELINLFYYNILLSMYCNSVSLIKFYLKFLKFWLNSENTVTKYIFPRFHAVHKNQSLTRSQISE